MAAITYATRGLVALCDLIAITEKINKLQDDPHHEHMPSFRKASIINRIACFSFTTAESALLLSGAKSQNLDALKSWELIPRLLKIPIQLFEKMEELAVSADTEDTEDLKLKCIGVLEQTIGSIADIFRVMAEESAYYEKHYLEMSPEELKDAKRPIYESDYIGRKQVGEKPVDLEECRQNLAFYTTTANTALFIQAAGELKVASRTKHTIEEVYQKLQEFLDQFRTIPGQEEMGLLAMPLIPPILHDDRVLSNYICPITEKPIRTVVCDANGVTLYEKSAILNWLATNPTSPITRLPMRPSDLLERPVTQAVIDSRLRFHQENLAAYENDPNFLRASLTQDTIPFLRHAVNQENPHQPLIYPWR